MERIIKQVTEHHAFHYIFFLNRISNRNSNQIQIMSHATLISRTRNSEIFIGGFDQLVPINEVMKVVLYGSYIVVVLKVLGSTRSIYMFVYTYIIHFLFMLHFKNPCTEEPRGQKRYRLNRWFNVGFFYTIYYYFLHICINMMIIHRT